MICMHKILICRFIDKRLDNLTELVNPERVIPATIEISAIEDDKWRIDFSYNWSNVVKDELLASMHIKYEYHSMHTTVSTIW